MLQEHRPPADSIPTASAEPDRLWSPRRKLLVILLASILAWMLWGGAGLLVWRAFQD
jgi:hypothetical protein